MTTTNTDRAKRAQEALLLYALRTEQNLLEDTADVLADLLCDLRHWADVVGLDFDVESARSASHYEAEKLDHEQPKLVAHDGTPLDPAAIHQALIDLIEWDAFMGFNEAVVWKNARLAMGHSVEEEEEEGRACFHCAVRLDPDEGVDIGDGKLLCYDCDPDQGPCTDEGDATT